VRILIVGAGIGGMTLAALLEHRGVNIRLVERAPNFDHAGYMLGLWPLGYRVLHGLSLFETFEADSIEGRYYEVRGDGGRLVKRWNMDPIAERFGPNLSCTRPQLVRLLHADLEGVDLRFDSTIDALEQKGDVVEVTFDDGSRDRFDLVVGADGIHSRVRKLVFGDQPYFHTGWGGWVWWADLESVPSESFVEHWGAGRFVGAYPTKDGAGIFAGAPKGHGLDDAGPGRRERVREQFAGMGDFVDDWLDAMPGDDDELFFWSLSDVRSATWTNGRVVLLGDAAAAFLPTAGIGASMAMESAAVLADELSRTNARFIEHALSLFVKRRRDRVERIQDESRRLARMMFMTSTPLTRVRNLMMKHYSLERLAGSIAEAFNEPI
jgi:2-polyprenyl-6-methoxyphenol hydroxylase-like FAD-dependent oxidoreductase